MAEWGNAQVLCPAGAPGPQELLQLAYVPTALRQGRAGRRTRHRQGEVGVGRLDIVWVRPGRGPCQEAEIVDGCGPWNQHCSTLRTEVLLSMSVPGAWALLFPLVPCLPKARQGWGSEAQL